MGAGLSLAEKRRKQNEEFFKSPKGQKYLNSKQVIKYREKRLKAMQPEVDRRFREEKMHITGHEPVWFSRYVLNGTLRHWVLMAHGRKYELRNAKNVGADGEAERDGRSDFTFFITDFTIPDEKRQAALADISVPTVDGYYICLIGWTTLQKEAVEAICRNNFQSFGNYHLLRDNCQTFLKSFAQQIVFKKAADYDWFYSNTKTRYQKTQDLMPPPAEMLIKMQQQARTMTNNVLQNNLQIQNQMNVQTNLQLQNQMQNQLDLQLQNQLQNQLNLQLQLQIQNQIQNQIMMQQGGMGA